MQERQEVPRELLEAHRDPSEPFDALKEVLDETPLAIDVSIERVVSPSLVRRVRREHRRAPLGDQLCDEGSRAVRAVAGDVRILNISDELERLGHLVCLPGREQELHRVSKRVHEGVDLRGRTSARTPYFLGPPL